MEKALGLEYEVRGEGEPVLLIHGALVADAMLPLTREDALADRYQLIRYRRRGYADSDPPDRPFTIADQARDAAALLAHLEVERAHVIGHSYGAVTAIQLALDAPDAVHSLALLEPLLMTAETAAKFSEQITPLVEAYGSGDGSGAVDMFMQYVYGPDWRAEVAETVPGGPEQAEADAATFFEVEVPAGSDWDFGPLPTDRLSGPTLFVVGTESDPVFEAARDLFCSAVPEAEEATLPGLNHLLQQRDPALVAELVAEFLGRHPL